jgi:hypothetical protein
VGSDAKSKDPCISLLLLPFFLSFPQGICCYGNR